uniref:Uncharacterized protein n=1 Tax=Opuntia streptacantha TaxID=393608 RepID=A0A7C9E073_OPUST
MCHILMTKDYVVVHRRIVNGKLRRATSVWHHSIGTAVESASLMKECSKFTNVAAKKRKLYGELPSEKVKAQTLQGQPEVRGITHIRVLHIVHGIMYRGRQNYQSRWLKT